MESEKRRNRFPFQESPVIMPVGSRPRPAGERGNEAAERRSGKGRRKNGSRSLKTKHQAKSQDFAPNDFKRLRAARRNVWRAERRKPQGNRCSRPKTKSLVSRRENGLAHSRRFELESPGARKEGGGAPILRRASAFRRWQPRAPGAQPPPPRAPAAHADRPRSECRRGPNSE